MLDLFRETFSVPVALMSMGVVGYLMGALTVLLKDREDRRLHRQRESALFARFLKQS